MSYQGHSLGVSYPSIEKHSMYSTHPADWANVWKFYIYIYTEREREREREREIERERHTHTHIYMYIYILIMSCLQHGYPWLSCHFSLSFISSGMSSGLHPVSSHCCSMYVRAGRPAFARPYVGVHRSTSLIYTYIFEGLCITFCLGVGDTDLFE